MPYDTAIPRRTMLAGLAGLPLAAILADAKLAAAAASTTQEITVTTADGRVVRGALAMPATTPAPVVLLIHEWWGLNDQIKTMATEFAEQGYIALAVDLFGGVVATTREEAKGLTQSVKADDAVATMTAWNAWARGLPQASGKVGVLGWCFGGGWALNTAVAMPVDATVVYYGRVNLPAAQLANLTAPVLGHFGTQDSFIDETMVGKFEAAMKEADKPYTVHWYDANHAFANPTGNNFDKEDAQLAWSRSLAFLAQHLKA